MSSQPADDADLLRAQNLLLRMDLPAAESAIAQVLARHPEHRSALYLMAAVMSARMNFEAAAEWLARAAKAEPGNAHIQADLGRVLLQINRVEDGVAALEIATRLTPTAAALSDLGHGLLLGGRIEDAERVLRQALSIDRNLAVAHCNLGAVLRAKREPQAAVTCYATAARLRPEMSEAHHYEGMSRADCGDFEGAESAWERGLKLRTNPQILKEIAFTLIAYRRPHDAVRYLRRAADIAGTDPDVPRSLCAMLLETSKPAEAERIARKVIENNPPNTEDQLNLALALHLQDRHDPAIAAYRAAVALDPTNARALAKLGDALSQIGRDEEALPLVQEVLQADPDNAFLQRTWSVVLMRASRFAEAIEFAQECIRKNPAFLENLASLGTAQHESGDLEAAIATFRKVLIADPANQAAHLGLGISLLTAGQMAEGWREYDYRDKPQLPARFKRWDGSPLYGSQIVLSIEQGSGDVIQFARYAPLIAQQRGGRVLVACSPGLQRLMQTVPNVEAVMTSHDDPRLQKARLAALMLDVPALMGTTLETIPAQVPYLRVPPPASIERRNALHAAIDSAVGRLRVGLVWAGNVAHGQNRKRSLSIEQIEPIVRVSADKIAFFGLQISPLTDHDREAMKRLGIIDLSPHIGDFGDTAAALEKLDLLITIDTSTAHLAGALARPVWLMIPRVPDFRWMMYRPDSPWYPTMRLFRQEKSGEWNPVIEAVSKELRERFS